MFKDLKPYPERLGTALGAPSMLPPDWTHRRIKTLLTEVDRRTVTGTERLLSLRAGRGLVDHVAAGGKVIAPSDLIGYKVVRPGELVMNRMRAATGVFGLADSVGLVSPDYAMFRHDASVNPDYMLALLRSWPAAGEMRKRSRGMGTGESGFLRLYTDAFGAMRILWPSRDQQAVIVKYLGHANARIDRAIAAKRKLIALLDEQKQAIINQAVTRGLDPTVRLKNSGVAWLGSIPEVWQVWPIGRLARVGNGSTPSRTSPDFWDGGDYPWLNSSHANARDVFGSDQFVTPRALAACHLPIVRPGSVLMAITGQGKTRGKATLLHVEATINQHLAYITPDARRTSGVFLRTALDAAYPELRRLSDDSGSTKGALTCQDIKAFRVPVPPLREQQQIVEFVDRTLADSLKVEAQAVREIELLREFRTRLTADVVTGQLDVREVAAGLPDRELADLAGDVGADVEDDLDTEAAEFLEDVDA